MCFAYGSTLVHFGAALCVRKTSSTEFYRYCCTKICYIETRTNVLEQTVMMCLGVGNAIQKTCLYHTRPTLPEALVASAVKTLAPFIQNRYVLGLGTASPEYFGYCVINSNLAVLKSGKATLTAEKIPHILTATKTDIVLPKQFCVTSGVLQAEDNLRGNPLSWHIAFSAFPLQKDDKSMAEKRLIERFKTMFQLPVVALCFADIQRALGQTIHQSRSVVLGNFCDVTRILCEHSRQKSRRRPARR